MWLQCIYYNHWRAVWTRKHPVLDKKKLLQKWNVKWFQKCGAKAICPSLFVKMIILCCYNIIQWCFTLRNAEDWFHFSTFVLHQNLTKHELSDKFSFQRESFFSLFIRPPTPGPPAHKENTSDEHSHLSLDLNWANVQLFKVARVSLICFKTEENISSGLLPVWNNNGGLSVFSTVCSPVAILQASQKEEDG